MTKIFSNNEWTSSCGLIVPGRDVRLNYFDISLKTKRSYYEISEDIHILNIPYYKASAYRTDKELIIRFYIEPRFDKKRYMKELQYYANGGVIYHSHRDPITREIFYKEIKL